MVKLTVLLVGRCDENNIKKITIVKVTLIQKA